MQLWLNPDKNVANIKVDNDNLKKKKKKLHHNGNKENQTIN